MDISKDRYDEIVREIGNPDSPVGIDAVKTHIIIIHKLMEIERAPECLGGRETAILTAPR